MTDLVFQLEAYRDEQRVSPEISRLLGSLADGLRRGVPLEADLAEAAAFIDEYPTSTLAHMFHRVIHGQRGAITSASLLRWIAANESEMGPGGPPRD